MNKIKGYLGIVAAMLLLVAAFRPTDVPIESRFLPLGFNVATRLALHVHPGLETWQFWVAATEFLQGKNICGPIDTGAGSWCIHERISHNLPPSSSIGYLASTFKVDQRGVDPALADLLQNYHAAWKSRETLLIRAKLLLELRQEKEKWKKRQQELIARAEEENKRYNVTFYRPDTFMTYDERAVAERREGWNPPSRSDGREPSSFGRRRSATPRWF